MKKYFVVLFSLLLVQQAQSQNGELPPVYFNGNTNICPTTPYKLVLYDEFNGDTLQQPWITFKSWNGMNPSDHDDWGDARFDEDGHSIIKDANIEVSNGSIKLKLKREASSWHCATCSMSTKYASYSSARLATPYRYRYFNSGKFEARIKMPTAKYTHATMWTWYTDPDPNNPADPGRVNEIDIAEAYGVGKNGSFWGDFPRTNYSLHAWAPGDNLITNPYNLPKDVEIRNHYPNQSWWNWVWGTGFKQDEYHTYACEWDSTKVNFYVDGAIVNLFMKYYQTHSYTTGTWFWRQTHYYNVGSACLPDAGYWKTLPGFPYHKTSESNLQFTIATDEDYGGHPNGFVDQMEIDYVKIWQRVPENNWVEICDPHNFTINGPDGFCDTATYTVSNAPAAGYWLTPSPNLQVLSSSNSAITVKNIGSNPGEIGHIYYVPTDPSVCKDYKMSGHNAHSEKVMQLDKPVNTRVVVAENNVLSRHMVYYYLHADPYYNASTAIPGNTLTYEWDINYGPNLSLNYQTTGQTIVTPTFIRNYTYDSEIEWTLKITNSCGVITKNGYRNFTSNDPPWQDPKKNAFDKNMNLYVLALMPDTTDFVNAVGTRLAGTFIDDGASDETIISTIRKIELKELLPYIVWLEDTTNVEDSTENGGGMERKANGSPGSLTTLNSQLYPNPARDNFQVVLGNRYDSESPVMIQVYDITGRRVKHQETGYKPLKVLDVPITDLSPGIYTIKLSQGSHSEHLKMIKQ